MQALPGIINIILTAYFWTLLLYVAAHWLITLNIISPYNPVLGDLIRGLARLHEPVLRPIRAVQNRILPNLGGFDFSPLIALLLVQFAIRPLVQRVFT